MRKRETAIFNGKTITIANPRTVIEWRALRVKMNANKNCKSSATQRREILEYLQTGRSLNGKQALRKFGCFRLPARIHELKRVHEIGGEWRTTRGGKKFKAYFLK